MEALFHGHYSKWCQGIPCRKVKFALLGTAGFRLYKHIAIGKHVFFSPMPPSASCYKHFMCCSKLAFKHWVYMLFLVCFIATKKTHLFLVSSVMNHRPVISSFPSTFYNFQTNSTVSKKAVISFLPVMFFAHFLFDFPEPYDWKEHWEIIWTKHPWRHLLSCTQG